MSEMVEKAKRVIEIEMESLDLLKNSLGDGFECAVRTLKETVEQDKKIVILGVGKSGNIGHKVAATLNSTGASAVVLNAQDALHGDLGILSEGDTVLAFSYSGETKELIDLLPYIKRQNVSLIGVSGKKGSTLDGLSDCFIETPIEREACPLGLAPTSSSTVALVLGDALAMVLLDERGFTEDQFADYHPGGSLGKALLTRVQDIMRKDEAVAVCTLECTVMQTIQVMSAARSGACFVLNPDETLAGVFSHGDFARSYQTDPTIGEKLVREYMTTEPVHVHPQALAMEAVKLTQENRIDDLPVVGDDRKVLGVVDTQDFARLKLV